MATKEEVQAIFNESRNGANHFIRHPLARRFTYSDGVEEVVEKAGAYWLLDVLATEFEPVYRKATADGRAGVGIVTVHVDAEAKCRIELSLDDDEESPAYVRDIEFTDFPEGEWKLYLGGDASGGTSCILLTEY